MKPSIAMLVLLVLLFAPLAQAEDFKPTLPLLEIRLKENKPELFSKRLDKVLDDEDVKKELKLLAAYEDKDQGWAGCDATGVSENALVVHVAPMLDQAEIAKLAAKAGEAMIYHIVVGLTGRIAEPLSGRKAPDLDKLPAGYAKVDLQIDEGLQAVPEVPKEEVVLYAVWDADESGGSFIVAIGARGRKPVKESWITADDLKSVDSAARDKVRDNAKKALTDYITKSGAKIGTLKIMASGRTENETRVPWVFVDLAYAACIAVNEARDDKGLEKLEILLPFQFAIAEPPPPEQPPEKPVEYPKDDPAEKPDKKEDPKKD